MKISTESTLDLITEQIKTVYILVSCSHPHLFYSWLFKLTFMLSSFEWCSSPPGNAKIYFTYLKGFHGSFSTTKSNIMNDGIKSQILLMDKEVSLAKSTTLFAKKVVTTFITQSECLWRLEKQKKHFRFLSL